LPVKVKLVALVWKGINASLYRYSPFFCRGWRRFLLRSLGATIHASASPNRLAVIDQPWNLTMGAYSSVGPHSWIYALAPITIGEKTCVGDGVKVLTGTHAISNPNFALMTAPVEIGAGCWIATSAVLLPGVTVGDGAVVGACAVVTKDVEPWTVVAGNPARVIKKRVLVENGKQ
jgi:putative colanic acid biosynthesis acetyltransferase WcaF